MSEKKNLHVVDSSDNTPADAKDIEALWLDTELGDGIVDVKQTQVPNGKPRAFFRTHPNPAYRRQSAIYVHKPEGTVDETNYLVAPEMRDKIVEAHPCTIVTVMYRDGTVRLWPIKQAKDGRDNDAWISARAAAKAAITTWVRIVWSGRAYLQRPAAEGYAPDPDWSKLPSFNELVDRSFGEQGVIRDENHPVYRDLFGTAPVKGGDDDDEDL